MLFGKNLFNFGKKESVEQLLKNLKYNRKILFDFYSNTNGGMGLMVEEYFAYEPVPSVRAASTSSTASTGSRLVIKKNAEKAVKKPKDITPKKLYELKRLNEDAFIINIDPKYIAAQVKTIKSKINVLKNPRDYDRGMLELNSMLIRLKNRKKYAEFESFFSTYPYTTTKKINEVLKANSHLKMGDVEGFVPDLPSDAIEAMESYIANCQKLCGAKPYFYMIANKADFQRSQERRDPILLAQSPFGHFWQVLGAWDKEMVLLNEL